MKKIRLVAIFLFGLLLTIKVQALNSYCAYNITAELQHYTENLNISSIEDKNYSCYVFVDLTDRDWYGQDSIFGKKTCDDTEINIYRPARLYCTGITYNNDEPRYCENSNENCIVYGTVIYDANGDGKYSVEDEEDSDHRSQIRVNLKPTDFILNSAYVRQYNNCPAVNIAQSSTSNHIIVEYNKGSIRGEQYTSLTDFVTSKSIDLSLGLENYNICPEDVKIGIESTLSCEYIVYVPNKGKCTISATPALNNFGTPYSKENFICEQDGIYGFKKTYNNYIVANIKEESGMLTGTCQTIYVKYDETSSMLYYDTVSFSGATQLKPGQSTADSEMRPGKENDRYSDVETCTDVDVNHIKACGCIPAEVADITSKVYFILRLIGPIILLIIGGFEMAKAIAAQDESAIEKAKKKLVNKFIAAAAIFLVLTIIKLAVSLVAENSPGIFECVNILLDGYVI